MPDSITSNYDRLFLAGLRYHYLGRYWDSHHTLEKLWLDAEGDARLVAQVLIIAGAATIHSHWQRWNNVVALCDRGLERLSDCPSRFEGLDLAELRQELEALRDEARSLHKGGKDRFDATLIPRFDLSDVDREGLMIDDRYELHPPRKAAG